MKLKKFYLLSQAAKMPGIPVPLRDIYQREYGHLMFNTATQRNEIRVPAEVWEGGASALILAVRRMSPLDITCEVQLEADDTERELLDLLDREKAENARLLAMADALTLELNARPLPPLDAMAELVEAPPPGALTEAGEPLVIDQVPEIPVETPTHEPTPEAPASAGDELDAMNFHPLRKLASNEKVPGYSSITKKDVLLAAIRSNRAAKAAAVPA